MVAENPDPKNQNPLVRGEGEDEGQKKGRWLRSNGCPLDKEAKRRAARLYSCDCCRCAPVLSLLAPPDPSSSPAPPPLPLPLPFAAAVAAAVAALASDGGAPVHQGEAAGAHTGRQTGGPHVPVQSGHYKPSAPATGVGKCGGSTVRAGRV